MIVKINSHSNMDQDIDFFDTAAHYHHHHHCGNNDAYVMALICYSIYNKYKKWKMRRHIKKYLKIVVEFSNIIQDEKNILQDMKDAGIPYNDQYVYVIRLCIKQQQE